MRRRADDEKVAPWRRRIHAKQGEAIKAKLMDWVEANIGNVIDQWPDMPEGVTDRDANVWESLIAVADAAGGDWPMRAREAAKAIVKGSKGTPSLGVRLLSDMRDVFGVFEGMAGEERLTTAVILKKLHGIDTAPWGDMRGTGKQLTDIQLAKKLSAYAIEPKLVRIGGAVSRGYRQEDFGEAWKRYLPSPGPKPVTPVTGGQEPEE